MKKRYIDHSRLSYQNAGAMLKSAFLRSGAEWHSKKAPRIWELSTAPFYPAGYPGRNVEPDIFRAWVAEFSQYRLSEGRSRLNTRTELLTYEPPWRRLDENDLKKYLEKETLARIQSGDFGIAEWSRVLREFPLAAAIAPWHIFSVQNWLDLFSTHLCFAVECDFGKWSRAERRAASVICPQFAVYWEDDLDENDMETLRRTHKRYVALFEERRRENEAERGWL
ncbi:MAG: hypothetical protein MJ016_08370 [Victivallaceae bacterium]|nr:hypothetical protein [Victivallaceae bacterium]